MVWDTQCLKTVVRGGLTEKATWGEGACHVITWRQHSRQREHAWGLGGIKGFSGILGRRMRMV